jgi:hypothetical protein
MGKLRPMLLSSHSVLHIVRTKTIGFASVVRATVMIQDAKFASQLQQRTCFDDVIMTSIKIASPVETQKSLNRKLDLRGQTVWTYAVKFYASNRKMVLPFADESRRTAVYIKQRHQAAIRWPIRRSVCGGRKTFKKASGASNLRTVLQKAGTAPLNPFLLFLPHSR